MPAGIASTGPAAPRAVIALLWALAVPALHAQAPAAAPLRIENCVGSDTIELRAGQDSMLLDEPDRQALVAAMLNHYPVLGRDGFAPTALLLWRKPGSGWIYLALRNHTEKPGHVCALASFSAAVFEQTAPLLRKYFVLAPGSS